MPELEQIFRPYRYARIAVYGLSPLTKKLLDRLDGFQIIGLLDGYRTEGALYHHPILSVEEAIQSGVQLIIVAARPESCEIIAKRIGTICKEHRILLLDTEGRDLRAPKPAVYALTGAEGVSRDELARLIDAHDAVSVGLFDTLLMRRTLFPTDVFEIVDLRLRQRGIEIAEFPQKRLEAEKELRKTAAPTLPEIYTYFLGRRSSGDITAEDLARLEWETDRDLIVPREELCALLREKHRQGKPVYIVSDTFYSKSQLEGLLRRCGIDWYEEILSSRGDRTGKARRPLMVLREKISGKSCLHIGASFDADIKGQNDITSCRLYSGPELFELSGYLGLRKQTNSLSGRIQTGMLIARLFNSPFQFEGSGGRPHVDSAEDVGYLFFGPIVTGFVVWLRRQILSRDLKNVWFCARDGYLIKKLFDRINSNISSVYFLTSRTAAIRAGIENEDDIRYVEEMRFSGSLREQLEARFGISVGDAGPADGLMEHKAEILEKAKRDREHYRSYLQSLKTEKGGIAFFDLAARGTTQMYIERLLERPLKGFYFLWQDPELMREKGVDVIPFCQKKDLAYNYFILETILASPEPSIRGFDKNGEPCFFSETRPEHDLQIIQRVQKGISMYFEAYLRLDPEWERMEEKELEGAILSLIRQVEVRDDAFGALTVEDPFFGRKSSISDLL